MRTLAKSLVVAAFLLASAAHAFTYQGELTDMGALYTGAADLEFRLFDAASGGNMVGLPDLQMNVMIENGRFVVDLDQWTTEFDGTPLWLEIATSVPAGGGLVTLVPRQKLGSVPYSEYAYDGAGGGAAGDITSVVAGTGLTGGGITGDVTLNVDDNTVQNRVSDICPGTQTINAINQDGTIQCEIDDDTLIQLGCSQDQVPILNAGAWVCTDRSAHNHDASQVDSGTIEIARLPIGNSTNTVAAGDHVHTRHPMIATTKQAYIATARDHTILADASDDAITVTLPAKPERGQILVIKKINGAHPVTIGSNNKLVDGAAADIVLTTKHQYRQLQYDGTRWFIIGQ